MDPDSGGDFTPSVIFKTTVLTVAFSSFYYYKTEEQFKIFVLPVLKPAGDVKKLQQHVKKKKTIYLTFDDGPNKGTRNVMRILEEENVPATLFVIGEHVYGSRFQSSIYDSVSRKTLFEIANHSFTHAFKNKFNTFYTLPDSATKDFMRCADSLHLKSNIIRTPGRNIWRTGRISCTDIKNSIATADSLYNNGFKAIGWDLEWHFNNDQRLVQSAEEMILEIDSAFSKQETKTPGHLVLLAHDQIYINCEDSTSLHHFIIQLKKRDEFNFETVSEYPGLTAP